ncbi:hypothetical protein K435DRAFT_836570 [Dendrothele bispora CBS 962.96]|uniref:Uncharacterized protein n=1 Tax=Dendrothele bispora (strain CBS 962.96) TaxID=1314807 RepID=A0A4S8MIA4_DENBC|nr:hypothetical protein K435DRAFT_836570 [Dendrothele bispora CBS 962.96]
MAHTSPATFLVWSVASCMLGAFLVYHLWSFDRFKCLKWNHGPNSGPFKRIMIYSYVLSIPCIMAYSLGFAIIKYTEGWVYIPLAGAIVPKPYTEWHPSSRNAILPLYLLFSLGWGLEMITHLEELCFWYFLVNSSSSQENWFQSKYFRIWASGSAFALVYMLLTTILTRSDHLRSEAVMFLAGSLGSFMLTVCFLPVLWKFPFFLKSLKRENVDATTVTRLTKFHELNTIRVVFRFIFCCPLMILGIDGVKPHEHRVNENMFWTDFLAIVSAFGVVISSGITLTIFFPRDIGNEIAKRDALKERTRRRIMWSDRYCRNPNPAQIYSPFAGQTQEMRSHNPSLQIPTPISNVSTDKPWNEAATTVGEFSDSEIHSSTGLVADLTKHCNSHRDLPPLRPNRRTGDDVELGGIGNLTRMNLSRHNKNVSGRVNPVVHTYTSPINFVSNITSDAASRFTFARH